MSDIVTITKPNNDFYTANGYYKGNNKWALLKGDQLTVYSPEFGGYTYIRHFDDGRTRGLDKTKWNRVTVKDLPKGVEL